MATAGRSVTIWANVNGPVSIYFEACVHIIIGYMYIKLLFLITLITTVSVISILRMKNKYWIFNTLLFPFQAFPTKIGLMV